MKQLFLFMALLFSVSLSAQTFNFGVEGGFNASYFSDGDTTVGGNGVNYLLTLEASSRKDYGFYLVLIGGQSSMNVDSADVSRTVRPWLVRGGVGFTNSADLDLRVAAYLTGGFLTSPDLNIPQIGAGVSMRFQKHRIQPNLRFEMGLQPTNSAFKVKNTLWMNANIGVSYALQSVKPSSYQTMYY